MTTLQYAVQFSNLVDGELDRWTFSDPTGQPLTAETAAQTAEWYKSHGSNAVVMTREVGEWQ